MTDREREKHKTIAAAIHGVMTEVGWAEKSGRVTQGGNYTFNSDVDMIKAVRPAMLKHGLVMVPVAVDHTTTPDQGKSKQFLAHVMVSYLLMHVDSDQTQPIQMPGSGMDGREKGVFKALTGAYKYALRETFMIATGDDPEPADPAAEERNSLVRRFFARAGQDPEYVGSVFHSKLKDAGLDTVENVRMFCLWNGMKKPSHLSRKGRANLIDRLGADAGRAKYAEFVDAVMETPQDWESLAHRPTVVDR